MVRALSPLIVRLVRDNGNQQQVVRRYYMLPSLAEGP